MKRDSAGNTDYGARIPIYMETEDGRRTFKAIDDSCPEWNKYGVDPIATVNLPTEPDFEEFRQYASSVRATLTENLSKNGVYSSSNGASLVSLPSSAIESLPSLDIFSTPKMGILQLMADTKPSLSPTQTTTRARLAPLRSSTLKRNRRRGPAKGTARNHRDRKDRRGLGLR
ncbi:hypothetical protein NLG97_g1025 [Lecanicillium saksenae]|uniref:Uncharacterized protein n=1 Tax=Lecanicillium saksenae TaxID=468837 RepID=A0ACC1R6W2_9HYPO|nr:hypothetical protein NLG97_g1025 [Lecanicillium saksenae]